VSEFDLIVIGGGINGLWSALTARHQGLKVALYEKNDFASGTSGKSTQLIHGGLRYLEHGELKLVYESLHERTWLLKNLPQLVKPLMFYIPVFKRKPFLGIKYFIGLLLYYILSGGRGTFPKWVSPQKLKKENPNLETDFLLGALEYFDAQTNDRALCRFLAEECAKQGVSIFKEHEVVSIQKEPNGFSIEVLDRTKQKAMTVSAKVVLSAKGPWEDKKYLRPTRAFICFLKNLLESMDIFCQLPMIVCFLFCPMKTKHWSAPPTQIIWAVPMK
jgi:glycerol-3-phosphate dehydrogenase